ncbi:MAG: hypothetical protein ACOC89_00030 [Candidatus Saliniplasma sp.]
MGNKIFEKVVEELDFVGDILSIGMTKKAIRNEGAIPDTVSREEMKNAIRNHIEPALHDFISQKKAGEWRKKTFKKLDNMEGDDGNQY